ncbi:hypothetical protein [Nocardioides sp.]|uniref:AAA family ATPase n=1 Tax=Nocardioides sp. TaxID=35761 RepID=UPI002733D2EF|nr:hypothetical protein [Nocardioides sp.]MDP3891705.1 hypothetical protein [Nocardioides sp.]
MVCVLLVAAGAAWESAALTLLGNDDDIVVLKRCVDVNDLLAAASAGQADVAVVALDAPGLDHAAVEHLRRHRVRPVAVVPDHPGGQADAARARAHRIGLLSLLPVAELSRLAELVTAEEEGDTHPRTSHDLPTARRGPVEGPGGGPSDGPAGLTDAVGEPAGGPGRVWAVWGAAGAPGRSTVATGVAAELAARGTRTILVDADPWGGALAQQLGILDEASGLLAAARLSAGGDLAGRFASVQRAVNEQLTVITGLPRPDRWIEVRSGAIEHLVEVGREQGHVIIDVGFSLEQDPASDFGSRPGRNTMTLDALAAADEILVVGSADPLGLSRLARGLVDLRELQLGTPLRVVVNRMRAGLGWTPQDIAGMVEGFARIAGLHFLPDDQPAVDRALVAGRTLVETGDSSIGRELGRLVDDLVPAAGPAGEERRSRVSWRRGGRALPR